MTRNHGNQFEKYQLIFEASPLAIFVADAKTRRFTDCNRSAEKLSGFSKKELSAMIVDQLHPKDRVEGVVESFQKLVREKDPMPIRNYETDVLTKSGARVPVQITGFMVGENAAAFFRDTTESEGMLDELRRAKDFAENLINTTNTMVVELDSKGNLKIFNKAAENITGYTAEELIGRNWFEVIAPRDRYPEVWKEFERLSKGGPPKKFENPILAKSGEERYITWQNNTVVEAGKEVGVISFGIDITERKKAEDALKEDERRLAAALNDANKALKLLAGRELKMVELKKELDAIKGRATKEK